MPLAVSPILPVTPSGKSAGKSGKGNKSGMGAREKPDGDSVPRKRQVAKMAGRVEIVDTEALKSTQKSNAQPIMTAGDASKPMQQKSQVNIGLFQLF